MNRQVEANIVDFLKNISDQTNFMQNIISLHNRPPSNILQNLENFQNYFNNTLNELKEELKKEIKIKSYNIILIIHS